MKNKDETDEQKKSCLWSSKRRGKRTREDEARGVFVCVVRKDLFKEGMRGNRIRIYVIVGCVTAKSGDLN